MVILKLDKKIARIISEGISRPLRNLKSFWSILAIMLDQDAMASFRHEGARGGHEKWDDFSVDTLKTSVGTWKIRYGTDLRPLSPDRLRGLRQKWGFGHKGYMRKGIRRYAGNSKLLQASGLFRSSFKLQKITANSLLYGTKHRLADKIMSVKNREVLFITNQDKLKYAEQFKQWFLKGIKFA